MPDALTFDHYEVLTRDDGSAFELGRGAMGITYKAFDTNLRIPVALKVINGAYLNSEVARSRFIREARSAAKLRHRHVASVFHLGIDGDAYFYAMEFIDGETVDALIKRQGPLAPALALHIAAQVARALNAAQAHGLVHRDIKPANLMLVREDDELVVKVIDFGLAKASGVGESDDVATTLSTGGFVGTPHYASPEQLEEREIDVRSDIYSLGVTLWYMLSGQTPFAGSMAQVMSAHLSKPPPIERLKELPAPIAAVLRRMLEKDAANRPQTPAELRKELEDCAAQIAGRTDAGAEAEPNLTPILDEAARRDAAGEFEPGITVGGRYEIIADLGETNIGRGFYAREIVSWNETRLLLLAPDLLENPEFYTQLERDAERAAAVRHPNLLRIHGLETIEHASLVAMEWTAGFSLMELLRVRRELRAEEALPLLAQAAEGVDHALTAGLKRVDLALHQIFVEIPGTQPHDEEILRRPVGEWPSFVVKLNPLGITREFAASQTWSGEQTIAAGMSAPAADSGDGRARTIHALAAIFYELLGGAASQHALGVDDAARYTPLSTLSEKGNEVLRRALDPSLSFPAALAFYEALHALPLDAKRHENAAPIARPARTAPSTHPIPPTPKPPSAPRPRPSRSPFAIVAVGLTVAAACTGIYFFTNPEEKSQTPRPAPELENPPEQIDEMPPALVPKPVPVPEPPPMPVEAPPPSRQDLLKASMVKADALEQKEAWPACLGAWLKIASDFPESDTAKVHLNAIIETLRTRPDDVNAREFSTLREPVTEAAKLDILAAMTFLGDMLLKAEPQTAFDWYSAASARGQVSATRQLGLLLSNGVGGGSDDLKKAFLCFQAASEKGDVVAKYLLGECYLRGKGVGRDETRAVEYLREAADAGNLYAMDLLGTCYHQGLGVEQDFKKALELLTRASERGYAVASGDLGVLYMKGDGLPKADPQQAVKLFLKGVAAGDGNCMYYYALCFESGMGVRANQLQAKKWYINAAQAGNRPAAEWCRKNGVDIPPK